MPPATLAQEPPACFGGAGATREGERSLPAGGMLEPLVITRGAPAASFSGMELSVWALGPRCGVVDPRPALKIGREGGGRPDSPGCLLFGGLYAPTVPPRPLGVCGITGALETGVAGLPRSCCDILGVGAGAFSLAGLPRSCCAALPRFCLAFGMVVRCLVEVLSCSNYVQAVICGLFSMDRIEMYRTVAADRGEWWSNRSMMEE